ncbi:hypothetical protein ACT3SZ_14285 [Corynebacterium sp. AOP40-9SA-29]|uniref:hypothetical protein n=1 Tax=Corynebacterium sp. AOP40-9SA-29 TaxID=3457677 RepID=UPI0040338B74
MALEPVAPDVADVAQAFVDLQDARHGADYDDLFDVTKSMTLSYVDTAKDSVARADALFEAEDQSYLRFLGLAVGGVKVAKAR